MKIRSFLSIRNFNDYYFQPWMNKKERKRTEIERKKNKAKNSTNL